MRGRVYTYKGSKERAKEYFRVVSQWSGIFVDSQQQENVNFNFDVEEKETRFGYVQTYFSIDVTKDVYV